MAWAEVVMVVCFRGHAPRPRGSKCKACAVLAVMRYRYTAKGRACAARYEASAKRKARNRAKGRRRYIRNPEKYLAYFRQYYRRNAEQIKARERDRYHSRVKPAGGHEAYFWLMQERNAL